MEIDAATGASVTNILPVYDSTLLGGYFHVTFEYTGSSVGKHPNDTFRWSLQFASFLKQQFERDEKLKAYVAARPAISTTSVSASGIIKDLYDIGCPVDEWVEDYFTIMKSKVSKFEALLQLFNHLKTFGDDNTRSE